MSPTTPVYALRYPASSDPADVPTDMGELATDVEAALNTKAPSTQLAHTEITTNVTCTATTEATANTIITASAVTFDGATAALISFYAWAIQPPITTGSPFIQLALYQDGVSLGAIAAFVTPAAFQQLTPCFVTRRLTPAAGSRTYSIRGFVSTGSGLVLAGTGGSGQTAPAFIRITRA